MFKRASGVILASTLVLSLSTPASAQDSRTAIERVRKAYNVDYLEKAITIRLEHDYNRIYDNHDYGPEFHQRAFRRQHYVFDFQNDQYSSEWLTRIGNSNYHGRSFLKDGILIDMDYAHGLYRDNGEANFFEQYGFSIRESDVLLAIWLSRSIETARYEGEVMWLGLPHDVVEIDFPSSPPLQIFVRRKDGAITKMIRQITEDLAVYYTYRRHKKQDRTFIAQEHSVFAEGERLYFSYNRNIDVNDRQDRRAFEVDKGILLEPERVDQSEMTVEEIGIQPDATQQLIHHVGQGESYTTFMTTGDFITAFGGKAGFAERLKAYRDKTKNMLPLRYVVLSSHHGEEIAGAQDALAAGATLLTTEDGKTTLEGVLDQGAKIEVVKSEKDISSLRVFSASTDIAETILTAYFEPQKVVLQSSHYASPYKNSGFYAKFAAVTLYQSLAEDVRGNAAVLVSTESKKPETWMDFVDAVEDHDPTPCHRKRQICKN
jgi:hypothetical protein